MLHLGALHQLLAREREKERERKRERGRARERKLKVDVLFVLFNVCFILVLFINWLRLVGALK